MEAVHFLCIAFLGVLALNACAERYYFFWPNKHQYLSPLDLGLRYESVVFHSHDGTQLHGWFIPATGTPIGTVIHFHGNNKNVSGHLHYVEWLPRAGYNVFLFDYRGYGRSEGSPSSQGMHEDCIAALAYIRSRPDVDNDKFIIFGQSLGGTYALTALAEAPKTGIRAVVIEATFTGQQDIAFEKIAHYPLPDSVLRGITRMVINDNHNARNALRTLSGIPILFIHGTADDVVNYHHGLDLFTMAHEPKTFWTIPKGRHLDTFVYPHKPYRARLLEFLRISLQDSGEHAPQIKPDKVAIPNN